jgi:hypothetical protein
MQSAPLLLAIALAGVSEQITFVGSVVTPTARSAPIATFESPQGVRHQAVVTGRFNDPPRVVTIKPPRQAGSPAEVVVTYF